MEVGKSDRGSLFFVRAATALKWEVMIVCNEDQDGLNWTRYTLRNLNLSNLNPHVAHT